MKKDKGLEYSLWDKVWLTIKNQSKPKRFGRTKIGFQPHKCSKCSLWATDCWTEDYIQKYGCAWHSIWATK